jgi:hypothetical protein
MCMFATCLQLKIGLQQCCSVLSLLLPTEKTHLSGKLELRVRQKDVDGYWHPRLLAVSIAKPYSWEGVVSPTPLRMLLHSVRTRIWRPGRLCWTTSQSSSPRRDEQSRTKACFAVDQLGYLRMLLCTNIRLLLHMLFLRAGERVSKDSELGPCRLGDPFVGWCACAGGPTTLDATVCRIGMRSVH